MLLRSGGEVNTRRSPVLLAELDPVEMPTEGLTVFASTPTEPAELVPWAVPVEVVMAWLGAEAVLDPAETPTALATVPPRLMAVLDPAETPVAATVDTPGAAALELPAEIPTAAATLDPVAAAVDVPPAVPVETPSVPETPTA
jgi:hypothetical protein